MPPFHVACPYTCKPVCHCPHGPGGAAAPLLDARGAPVSAAQLSRNAQALWALCQAPGTAFDDAEGVLVAVPGLPRAPPPLRGANGEAALEAASAAAQHQVDEAERAVRLAQAAVERAERIPAPRKAVAAPAVAASALPAAPMLWDTGSDPLFGSLDDVLLFGGDDLALPAMPLGPGAPPRRRLLQWSEVNRMTGALLEVFWDPPAGGTPPRGWYTARALKLSQRGLSKLHYQQTNNVEDVEPHQLQSRVKQGQVAILQLPPQGEAQNH